MATLKLVANPTFKAKVGIPVAGEEGVTDVEMTFKHRTKTELAEFIETRTGKSDVESFMEMVVAWELADNFDAESVHTLLENYSGAAVATYRKYVNELMQAKVKN